MEKNHACYEFIQKFDKFSFEYFQLLDLIELYIWNVNYYMNEDEEYVKNSREVTTSGINTLGRIINELTTEQRNKIREILKSSEQI